MTFEPGFTSIGRMLSSPTSRPWSLPCHPVLRWLSTRHQIHWFQQRRLVARNKSFIPGGHGFAFIQGTSEKPE